MSMKNKIDIWIKVDALLQKRLKELEALDSQREEIIQKAEKMGTLTEELKQEMEENLAKYNNLAKNVEDLKNRVQKMKNNKG